MLTGNRWADIPIYIAAVLTAFSVIGLALRRLWRFIRLSVHAFETIQRELTPNGGGSTHDLVREHSKELADLKAKVEAAAGLATSAASEATEAASAASVAAAAAQVNRAVIAEGAERTRSQISEVRTAVAGLMGAMESDAHERKSKEVAYVKALNAVGVPLQPITAELDEIADQIEMGDEPSA